MQIDKKLSDLQSLEELNSGLPNTNPSSGKEEDLNPGLSFYKSNALTTRPRCLLTSSYGTCNASMKYKDTF